jgi:PIN domain nuclease of toxin-antitoxin system
VQLLLDTHALIWWLSKDIKLSARAYKEIANPCNLVFVSAASAWEIAIKKSIKKLETPDDLVEQIQRKKFSTTGDYYRTSFSGGKTTNAPSRSF